MLIDVISQVIRGQPILYGKSLNTETQAMFLFRLELNRLDVKMKIYKSSS